MVANNVDTATDGVPEPEPRAVLGALFEIEVSLWVTTGTAANTLALAAMYLYRGIVLSS
jgi:threonine aldolase